MRSIAEIGNLWPRCGNCKHIAQSHDLNNCCETMNGQCPTCNTWQQNIPCNCKGYIGPTLEEFKKLLTSQEIEYHGFNSKSIDELNKSGI